MSNTKQITIKITNDDDQDGPRKDYDNLGTMVCWHRSYSLGDEQPKCEPSEYLEELPEGSIILELYLMDHGSISMSTGSFSCRWDSGQVGFIYVTPETIIKEYGNNSDESRAKATSVLEGEVRTYDCFIQGNIWGYQVFEAEVCECCENAGEKEEIDGCWGFYDMDGKGNSALDAIRECIAEEHQHLLEKAWDNRSYGY